MTEKEMFAKLLKLGAGWKITEVKLNMVENRIDNGWKRNLGQNGHVPFVE